MSTICKAIIVGKLGVDPTTRCTRLGRKVTTLNIKTGRSGKKWIRVVVYDEVLVEFAERRLRKGTKVYAEGHLESRKWLGANGEGENWTVEVVMNSLACQLTVLDDLPETPTRPKRRTTLPTHPRRSQSRGQPQSMATAWTPSRYRRARIPT
jgi:single-strand DNA-binding protein